MPPNTPTLTGLELLQETPYGAYAVNLAQTIRLWNRSAERITGHKAQDVIGRHCYEVVQNCPADEKDPWCRDGCPSLQAIRANRMPRVYEVSMLCASGQRKTVSLTPMVVPEPLAPETLLVHLFQDSEQGEQLNQAVRTVERTIAYSRMHPEAGEQLTSRELEILKLTALGMPPREIAEELHISYHTVRNHTSNLRRKLGATSNLMLVKNAQELGLLWLETPRELNGEHPANRR